MISRLLNANAIKNSIWMILEKVFRLVLGLFVTALVARHIEPSGFGLINYLLAIYSVFYTVSTLGLNRIVVRELVGVVSNPKEISKILSTTFFLRLGAAILLYLILLVYAFLADAENFYLYFVLFLSLIFSPLDLIDLNQQAMGSVKLISIARTLSMLLTSALRIALVVWDFGLIWFVIAILFEYVFSAISIAVIFLLGKHGSLITRKHLSHSKASMYLKESWTEIIAGLGAILFMRLDQIMLNAMVGAEAVGIYSAASRLAETWYFIPVAITAATFPFILKGKEFSDECYLARLRILMSVLLALGISAGLAITFVSDFVISLLYGSEYIQSSGVLILLCWSGVFMVLGISSGSMLAAEKKLKWNLYRNLFGLCLNIIFNYVLIQKYGVTGAAVATVMSIACAFFIFDIFFQPMRYIFHLKIRAFNFFWLLNTNRIKKIIGGY